MFKFNSIKTQIAFAAGISLAAAILAMLSYGVMTGKSLHKTTSTSIIDYSEKMVSAALKQVSGQVVQVSRTISNGVLLSESIATTQSFLIQDNQLAQIDRDAFSQYLKQVLVENPQVGGTYIAWEPNAVDGADARYINEGSHSDYRGQYSPYWTRSATGTFGVRPSNMKSVYQDTSRNQRGLRPGEWYWCPFESGEACVSQPSVWEVQGVPTLMTSITTPLIVNGNTLGVAGVDISLRFIQQLTERVNSNIFGGAGELKIISFNGYIVADTNNADLAGEMLDDNEWAKLKDAVQNGEALTDINSELIQVLLPLTFAQTDMKWAVELTLPTHVAMQEATLLNQEISDKFASNIFGQLMAGILVGLGGMAIVFYVAGRLASPVRQASSLVTELSQSEGDLTRRVRITSTNEVGAMASGINAFLEKTHEIVKQTSHAVNTLTAVAEKSASISEETERSVSSQKEQLNQLSSAVYQMSQASAEVARNCSDTASSAEQAHTKVQSCAKQLDDTVQSLNSLTAKMRAAAGDMDELETATQSISGILDVIKAISEQTNLLALNAAIEAARAGEQGRGFAVVADEVRTLASRTQQSTEQINDLMQSLMRSAATSVQTMRDSTATCEDNAVRAQASQQQLQEIFSSTQSISGASISIASAVEQQNEVAGEISRNVTNINDAVNLIADYATEARQQSQAVGNTAQDIQSKLHQFKY